jgi:hypothetical protein
VTSLLTLPLICVYMPFEDNDEMTDEFIKQLAVFDDVIVANQNCHIIARGDFNVDFARDRLYTTLLDCFFDQVGLCDVDYSYNFNMCTFNTLDHFLLSDTFLAILLIGSQLITIAITSYITILLFYNWLFIVNSSRLFVKKNSLSVPWGKVTNDNLPTYRIMSSVLYYVALIC